MMLEDTRSRYIGMNDATIAIGSTVIGTMAERKCDRGRSG